MYRRSPYFSIFHAISSISNELYEDSILSDEVRKMVVPCAHISVITQYSVVMITLSNMIGTTSVYIMDLLLGEPIQMILRIPSL